MGKIFGALALAMVLTGLLTEILPYNDYAPKTPERFLAVSVFYTSWFLLILKFMFGEFIPLEVIQSK